MSPPGKIWQNVCSLLRSLMWKPLISGWLCVCSSYLLRCWNMLGLILSPGNRRSSYAWGEDKGGHKRQVLCGQYGVRICACYGYGGLHQQSTFVASLPLIVRIKISCTLWILLNVMSQISLQEKTRTEWLLHFISSKHFPVIISPTSISFVEVMTVSSGKWSTWQRAFEGTQ